MGDPNAARRGYERAAQIGKNFADPDLFVLAQVGVGEAFIGLGEVDRGIGLMDEAMVDVTSGEVSPVIAGISYCSVIAACHQVFDVRRAQEWTAALDSWCDPSRSSCTSAGSASSSAPSSGSSTAHGITPPPRRERRASNSAGRSAPRRGHLPGGRAPSAPRGVRRGGSGVPSRQPAGQATRAGDRAPAAGAGPAGGRRGDHGASHGRGHGHFCPRPPLGAPDGGHAGHRVDFGGPAGRRRDGADRRRHPRAPAERHGRARARRRPPGRSRSPRRPGRIATVLDGVAGTRRALRGSTDPGPDRAGLPSARRRRCGRAGARRRGRCVPRARRGPRPWRVEALLDEPAPPSTGGLTARELEVLRLVASGKTNREVATDLVISERTVDRHVSNIFDKIGVPSRAAATAYAYEHGLITPPG